MRQNSLSFRSHGLTARIVHQAHDALGNPLYPSTTGSAIVAQPTVLSDSSVACQADPYSFTNTSSLQVRNEHPLLMAPSYKWECLKTQSERSHPTYKSLALTSPMFSPQRRLPQELERDHHRKCDCLLRLSCHQLYRGRLAVYAPLFDQVLSLIVEMIS